MPKFIITYGKGRPGGNIERLSFESYEKAYQYAADNARGWGFSVTLDERVTKDYWINGTQLASASEAMAAHREGKDVVVWYHNSRTITIPGATVERDREKTDRENRAHCRSIAQDLESYAAGNVYRCPDCDAILELPDDVGDKYRCPDCGTVHEIDELEQLSLWDYFDETYDIKYLIDSDCKTVNSVKICVAWGGPSIYIDTESRAVELYWWGDRASYPIDHDVCGEIDDWAQELFDCH